MFPLVMQHRKGGYLVMQFDQSSDQYGKTEILGGNDYEKDN